MWYNFPNSRPCLWASSQIFSGNPGSLSHPVLKVASEVWKEAESHLMSPHWPFLDSTDTEYTGVVSWDCTLQTVKKKQTNLALLFSSYGCRKLGTQDRILLLDPAHCSVPCKHYQFCAMGLRIGGRNLSWLCVWFLFFFFPHKHKIHF